MGKIEIAYHIQFLGNTIRVTVGKNYWKLIKYRMMNLHGMYYLLSDLAHVVLQKNGYLTLYASAVHYEPKNRGVVFFAPPNTGKTVTATKLSELPGYRMVGEDVVITNGETLYSCPWTSSYRRKETAIDSAGSFGRITNAGKVVSCHECELTDVNMLLLGESKTSKDEDTLFRKICVLNGYLFNYNVSPLVKVLGFFDKEYDQHWNLNGERMLRQMIGKSDYLAIQAENPIDFYKMIHSTISGNNA